MKTFLFSTDSSFSLRQALSSNGHNEMISLPYPTIKRFHLDHNRLLWLLLPFVFVLVQSDINVLSYNYSAYLARHKSIEINQKFQSPQTVLIRSKCSDEYIELGPSGKIRAEGSENSEHASLTIQYGPLGMVRIRGSENKYMCFNQKGRLILRRNPKIYRCIFVARMMNGTYIFQLASFQRMMLQPGHGGSICTYFCEKT
ncbi:fibroblast growth factor 8b-like isoform X3 [Octopus vulgaris]|uniref:Fibroblast growth factor 8b-like isoform X3 n=1 Tax=Octopus vulgaris TaxID=6645 RepID=A0AA36BL31_OCTVU|nr:fibroblast growth factor 8b-like isoform X3 [Octopus vulgaris]